MANSKNDNKSLFMYTALIFFVALLLIILSFFGQTNLENHQPKAEDSTEQSQQLSGISERAAVLSEENNNLLDENTKITKENEDLKSENDSLTSRVNTNDLLLSANAYLSQGDKEKALEIISSINYDDLNSDQKIIYDSVKN
jgi:cell division protein FtsB